MPPFPTARRSGVVVAAVALLCSVAFAQDAAEETEDADLDRAIEAAREQAINDVVEDVIEEVIVVAPPPGGRRRLDSIYVDPLKERIMKDLEDAYADREESAWRAELAEQNDSRIKLGYDPRDEYRLRNEMDLTDLPSDINKPATLFRIGF